MGSKGYRPLPYGSDGCFTSMTSGASRSKRVDGFQGDNRNGSTHGSKNRCNCNNNQGCSCGPRPQFIWPYSTGFPYPMNSMPMTEYGMSSNGSMDDDRSKNPSIPYGQVLMPNFPANQNGFVQMVCVPYSSWSTGVPTYQEYAAAMPGIPLIRDASGAYYTIDAHGNYAIVPLSTDSKFSSSPSLSGNGSSDSSKDGKPGPGGDAGSKCDAEPNDPGPNFFDRSFISSSYGTTFMRRSFASLGRVRRNTSTYKTMMCTMFSNNGTCTYGLRCQYAHGKEDLRVVAPHPKFKTQPCNKYNSPAGCQYGDKCHFIHPNQSESSISEDS